MDRAKMIAGDPSATWQVILDPLEGGHMPADLDGFAPPPGGAPGIFTSLHGDGMYLYRMKVDCDHASKHHPHPASDHARCPCGGRVRWR